MPDGTRVLTENGIVMRDMVIQGLLPVKKGGNSDKKAKNAIWEN